MCFLDRVATICSSHYETRLSFAACATTQPPEVRIYPGENVVLLPVALAPSTPINVRSVLQSVDWRHGDTVCFCVLEHTQHTCVNPVVLTWRGANAWSPANIDPVHSLHTRYRITTSNTHAFVLA